MGVAGKPKTMCVRAANEARCRIMWDMKNAASGRTAACGVVVVFGFPDALIHKPDYFIGKLSEHGAAEVDEAG